MPPDDTRSCSAAQLAHGGHLCWPDRCQPAHGLRCSVRGDGGAVHAMLHKLRGMVRRQPAGAAEASPCSAFTAEPALAMPLARLSQLSPGCDPGARSRVMGTPCYALPKHARREKGICRSPHHGRHRQIRLPQMTSSHSESVNMHILNINYGNDNTHSKHEH